VLANNVISAALSTLFHTATSANLASEFRSSAHDFPPNAQSPVDAVSVAPFCPDPGVSFATPPKNGWIDEAVVITPSWVTRICFHAPSPMAEELFLNKVVAPTLLK